jgi:hypothetical protein
MSTQQLLLNNWQGGIRAGTLAASPNESGDLVNLDHIAGSLAAVDSVDVQIPLDTAGPTGADQAIYSIEPYVDARGVTNFIARRGKCLWVGKPQVDYDRTVGPTPLSQWTMDETGDTVPDHALAYDLTSHATVVEQEWSTNTRYFDGITSALLASGTSVFNLGALARSVSVWVRPENIYGGSIIAGKFNTLIQGVQSWGLYLDIYGCLEFWVSDGTNYAKSVSNSPVTAGVWQHWAASYAPGSFPIIYVNGVAVAVTTSGSVGNWNSDNATLFSVGGMWGGSIAASACFLQGAVGTLSIYEFAISSSDASGQYASESGRYFPPTSPVPIKWVPLLVDTVDNGTSEVILRRRVQFGRESVEQIGENAYMSPLEGADGDYLLRWDGTLVDKATVYNPGTLINPSGYNGGKMNLYAIGTPFSNSKEAQYQFETANIRPGDILIIKPHPTSYNENDPWALRGHRITAVIPQGSFQSVCTPAPAEPATGAMAPSAAIVRVHRAGVAAGTTTTAALGASTGGSLAQGQYKYCWRYGNSLTAYFGNASLESAPVTIGASDTHEVNVSGWLAQPDWDVDTLEIYRTFMGPSDSAFGPYYLVSSITSVAPDSASAPFWVETIDSPTWWRRDLATFNDAGAANIQDLDGDTWADSGIVVDGQYGTVLLEAVGHERPPILSLLHQFNSRLVGAGTGADACTRFVSTLGQFEYWPGTEYDEVGASPTNTNMGCAMQLGQSIAEPITAMVAEVGVFITTGIQGSDELVFLPDRAVRVSGNTVADFQISEGVAEYCSFPSTLMRCGGELVWLDGEHIRRMALGASDAAIISYNLWPRGLRAYVEELGGGIVDIPAMAAGWAGGYKDGWYYLACGFAGANDRIYAYHLASNTWTRLTGAVTDLTVAALAGCPSNPCLLGSSGLGVSGLSSLVNLSGVAPSVTNPQAVSWISAPVMPAGSPDELRKLRHVSRVTGCFRTPVGLDQVVTLSLYGNGDITTSIATCPPKTLVHAATTGARQVVEWTPPAKDAMILQLGISATLTAFTALEWLQVQVDTH